MASPGGHNWEGFVIYPNSQFSSILEFLHSYHSLLNQLRLPKHSERVDWFNLDQENKYQQHQQQQENELEQPFEQNVKQKYQCQKYHLDSYNNGWGCQTNALYYSACCFLERSRKQWLQVYTSYCVTMECHHPGSSICSFKKNNTVFTNVTNWCLLYFDIAMPVSVTSIE